MIAVGLERVDGVELHVPRIVCDACALPIVGIGNAYWLVRDTGEVDPRVWHTHKHPCAGLDRVLAANHSGVVLFEELDVWLAQLARNLSPERSHP